MGFQYKQISIEERCDQLPDLRCRRILASGKSLQIWIARHRQLLES